MTTPPPAPRTPARTGYLAATLGAIGGGAAACAIGLVWMGALMSPDGGLGDLVYILIPMATTPFGTIAGTYVGLRSRNHTHAAATTTATAAMLLATLAAAFLGATLNPVGSVLLVLLVGAPALARWLVLEHVSGGVRDAV